METRRDRDSTISERSALLISHCDASPILSCDEATIARDASIELGNNSKTSRIVTAKLRTLHRIYLTDDYNFNYESAFFPLDRYMPLLNLSEARVRINAVNCDYAERNIYNVYGRKYHNYGAGSEYTYTCVRI